MVTTAYKQGRVWADTNLTALTIGGKIGAGPIDRRALDVLKARNLSALKGITDDESKLLHELYAAGDTRAQFMEDTRLQIMGNPAMKAWAKVLEVAGYPMEVSERFNRASLALAAYRAARAGHVDKAETLGQFHVNPGQKFGHDNAVKFAREEANSISVTDKPVGAQVFGYLFA